MTSYIRFASLLLFYYPISYFALLAGGLWPYVAIGIMTLSQVLVDNVATLDKDRYAVESPRLLDGLLYLHLPLGTTMLGLMMWQAAPGDLAGVGQTLSALFGSWIMRAHEQQTSAVLIGNAFLGGFILSSNTVAGHELVHRLQRPFDLWVGRWLLAMNGDAQFSISHVFGHHANFGTPHDPATARRGEPLYAFVLRSAVGQYREAGEIESKRLARAGRGFWSPANRLLTGLFMTAFVVALCYIAAGWSGLGVFLLTTIYSKFMFETVNYIQHYGLVRAPGERAAPRHSWDCLARAASNAFYALTRHSNHHVRPGFAFWLLEPSEISQTGLHLRYGYLASMMLAMLPPLWFRITSPMLLHWDREYATAAELELAQEANRRSRLLSLTAAARA